MQSVASLLFPFCPGRQTRSSVCVASFVVAVGGGLGEVGSGGKLVCTVCGRWEPVKMSELVNEEGHVAHPKMLAASSAAMTFEG
jgi:hypothetical protein